ELGEAFTVYGQDYSADGTATIVLQPRSGDAADVTVSDDVSINADGTLEYEVDTSEFAEELESGNYLVVVSDNLTGNTSSKTVTFNAEDRQVSIRLTPSVIQEGADNIRVIGTGYTPDTEATVYLRPVGPASGLSTFALPVLLGEEVGQTLVDENGEINYQ